MRQIKRIIIHAAATRPSMDIGVKEIRRWHMERGWRDVGYHYVIRRDGTVEPGRSLEQTGAHAYGHNRDTIGICLVGGVDARGKAANNFTRRQWRALTFLVRGLQSVLHINSADILGHRDLPGVAKACPCFDVASFDVGEASGLGRSFSVRR